MKLLVALFFIVLIFFLIYFEQYNDKYRITNTTPSFIISSKEQSLYIGDIINYKSNKKYIIAQRVVTELYSCPDYSNPVIYFDKLGYVILNKNSGKIYITEDKNTFEKKKYELNINLKLDYINIIPNKYKRLVEESSKLLFSDYLKQCNNISVRTHLGTFLKLR